MEPLISFWKMASRLKTEPRKGWINKLRLQRTESVADHSFALSLLCLFEGQRRGYDTNKMLRLAILHDLEEAVTGDLTPEDKKAKGVTVVEREKNSAREQVLSFVPEGGRRVYRELWAELDDDKTREARLVHELDKMEMALQAYAYSKGGVETQKLREFYGSAKNVIKDAGLQKALSEISS